MSPLRAGGDLLAHEERGSGDPIVFLHGLTFDRSSWRRSVEALSQGFRCIAVDLPGHGATPGPPRPLGAVVAEVAALLDALEVERPLVVGHSMGAVLAVLYAGEHPVRGVVTVDQPLDVLPFVQLIKRLEPALRADFHAAFEPFERDIGVDRLAEPERSRVSDGRRVRPELVMGYWEEILGAPPEHLQERLDGAAQRITAPVLAIFGRSLDDAEALGLRRRLGVVEIEERPGRGHLVHLVEADLFAQRLDSFARRCFADPRVGHP